GRGGPARQSHPARRCRRRDFNPSPLLRRFGLAGSPRTSGPALCGGTARSQHADGPPRRFPRALTNSHRVLFVEKSFGLSGSTMSLATLLTHLDRQAYIALVAVSRPEQRDYLLRQIDGIDTVAVIDERASFARTPTGARLLALVCRHMPILRRPLLWLITAFDLFFSTVPYALRLAWFGRSRCADLL